MIDEWLANQWSNGLFQLAREIKKITQFAEESNKLIDIFTTYSEFIDITSSSNLTIETRKQIISETFKNHIEPYMLNFFFLLIDEHHFQCVRFILKEFRKLCNEYQDVNYGIIYSVIELSNQQINQIKLKIEKVIKHKIKVVNKIDKSLIGGIKVKVRNQVFDGSVKGQIDQLKQELLSHE
ncbi:F0F1 ATP synthase subunit delta [Spiroplasma ixodetis]|uniref:ATP synthase subunit delta n=1 Tax=Spiroplasma ixodetis TaxID=2141 RepID=A0ABN7BWB3_9MOLU